MRIERLMEINRSITGDGVRDSLEILREQVDFDICEIPSGKNVFDWEIPQEWVIRGATLTDDKGRVWANYDDDFLHVVSYSEPVDDVLSFEELKPHLHSGTDVIPYRTSYYNRDWGFCVKDMEQMDKNSKYHVKIDSEFKDGGLTYGEKVIGKGGDEYIISTYCCHPNMVNDNTAGMVMWADLLSKMGDTKNTYRFIIAPETIGMIGYLATHDVSNVKGAMVLSHTVGKGDTGFKQSFKGNSYMDRIARQVLDVESPFSIRGGDERQLSSPAFRIPTILVNKGGLYSEKYHTSGDRNYTQEDYDTTLKSLMEIIYLIENDEVVESNNPFCEPMLGKRGLYPSIGGENQNDVGSEVLLTIMFHSGKSLLDIAEETGMDMRDLVEGFKILKNNNLIK